MNHLAQFGERLFTSVASPVLAAGSAGLPKYGKTSVWSGFISAALGACCAAVGADTMRAIVHVSLKACEDLPNER